VKSLTANLDLITQQRGDTPLRDEGFAFVARRRDYEMS